MGTKKLKSSSIKKACGITNSHSRTKKQKPPSDPIGLLSSKLSKSKNGSTIVVNNWSKKTKPQNLLRVIKIIYFSGVDDLSNLNALHPPTSNSIIRLNHLNINYILRKTSIDVAKALMNIYSKIKSNVEDLIGYLVTATGNVYLITKPKNSCSSFDAELSSKVNKYENPRFLDKEERLSIFEKTLDQLTELTKKDLILKDLSLKNIIYSKNSVFLSDLRSLRMSLKPKILLGTIISFLKQLFQMDLISRDELTYLLTYYIGANPELCTSWYIVKYSQNAEDIEVLDALESEIIGPQHE